jgi:hypothetical protein
LLGLDDTAMKSDRIRKPSRAKEKQDAQSGYFGSNPQRWLAIQLAGSAKVPQRIRLQIKAEEDRLIFGIL